MSGTIFLCNAISLNLIAGWAGGLDGEGASLHCHPMPSLGARALLDRNGGRFVSAIGHPDLARMVSHDLGIAVPVNRCSVVLGTSDVVIVAQYAGPRLDPGCTELPEGAEITYWRVIADEYGEFTEEGWRS